MARSKQASKGAPSSAAGSSPPGSRTVFATVGTTRFEALVQALDDPLVADALAKQGYTSLVMQIGSGAYKPCRLVPEGQTSATLANGMHVEYFDFAPSLAAYMSAAALVISHAGSGSIFEALSLGKPLVVVPNELLMDNHQAELAEHLANMRYCIAATPGSLLAALQGMDLQVLVPYDRGDASGISKRIDRLMGF